MRPKVAAREILESRGSTPRLFRNTLVFLAVDKVRYQDLDEALRRYLAWVSILDEREELNLDPHQARQAETQRNAADDTVTARLPEAYQWLLVPEQERPDAAVSWQAIRLTAAGALAERAGRRLRNDELLVTGLGATILRRHLDEVPLWRGDKRGGAAACRGFRPLPVPAPTSRHGCPHARRPGRGRPADLAIGFIRPGREPRRGSRALPGPCRWDRQPEFLLKARPCWSSRKWLVGSLTRKCLPRRRQLPWVRRKYHLVRMGLCLYPPPPEKKARRFHGAVTLDATRVGRDAGQIADEVISHLSGLVGSEVTVTLEIDAEIPDGAPENVVRTVTENSRTLKFDQPRVRGGLIDGIHVCFWSWKFVSGRVSNLNTAPTSNLRVKKLPTGEDILRLEMYSQLSERKMIPIRCPFDGSSPIAPVGDNNYIFDSPRVGGNYVIRGGFYYGG